MILSVYTYMLSQTFFGIILWTKHSGIKWTIKFSRIWYVWLYYTYKYTRIKIINDIVTVKQSQHVSHCMWKEKGARPDATQQCNLYKIVLLHEFVYGIVMNTDRLYCLLKCYAMFYRCLKKIWCTRDTPNTHHLPHI